MIEEQSGGEETTVTRTACAGYNTSAHGRLSDTARYGSQIVRDPTECTKSSSLPRQNGEQAILGRAACISKPSRKLTVCRLKAESANFVGDWMSGLMARLMFFRTPTHTIKGCETTARGTQLQLHSFRIMDKDQKPQSTGEKPPEKKSSPQGGNLVWYMLGLGVLLLLMVTLFNNSSGQDRVRCGSGRMRC